MYRVEDLFERYGKELGLQLCAGTKGLKRDIEIPEAERPGLSLSGYMKGYVKKRILIFGNIELEYLNELDTDVRNKRLKTLLTDKTPAVMIAKRSLPLDEMHQICEEKKIPLFKTKLSADELLSKLTLFLLDEFAPSLCCHGTFVEIFGVGVLIQGDSSVGKSEAALSLIGRRHCLISDDIVKVKKKEGRYLEGFGPDLSRYHMEIRGIGIINVANLFGIGSVKEKKNIDIVVKMESCTSCQTEDPTGIVDKKIAILGIEIPFYTLPVKAGQDIALFFETIALNHRLKKMGSHSAKEFKTKLLSEIERKRQMEMHLQGVVHG